MVKNIDIRDRKVKIIKKVTCLVSPDIIAAEALSFVMFIAISTLHFHNFTPLYLSAFLYIATPTCTLESSSSI